MSDRSIGRCAHILVASSPCRRVTSWIKAIAWAIVVFHDNALAAGRDIIEVVDLELTTPLERLSIELQV